MNLRKKTLSLCVAFALFNSQTLFAVALGDLAGTAVSSAGTWQSPATKTKYHYGGSYQFTFKGGNRAQPWITVGKPEFKVGCNGMSIRGGFLGLLGLNEIKDQLRDSGASLAWGVLIGLQYAMPALFGVFDTIRRWATTIQNLLQNSCRLGQALVANSLEGRKTKTNVENWLEEKGEALETSMSGVSAFFDNLDNMVQCADLTGDAYDKCRSQINHKTKDNLSKLSNSNVSVGSGSMFLKYYYPPSNSSNTLEIEKISSLLTNGQLGSSGRTLIPSTRLNDIKMTYLMRAVFFGDFTISQDSFKKIAEDTSLNLSSLSSGTYTIDEQKYTDNAKKSILNPDDEFKPVLTYTAPLIADPKKAARVLMHGLSAEANSGSCSQNVCNVPDSAFMYADFAIKTAGNTEERIQPFGGIIDTNIGGGTIPFEWAGAYNESLSAIRTMVQTKSGVAPGTLTNVSSYTTTTTTSFNVPLFVPNMMKYIEIIAALERAEGAETPTSAMLKKMLAQYNAKQVSLGMAEVMYQQLLTSMEIKGKQSSEIDDAIIRHQTMINDIKQALKEEDSEQITQKDLEGVFNLFDNAIKTNKLKDIN